jgi:hypothetical protein
MRICSFSKQPDVIVTVPAWRIEQAGRHFTGKRGIGSGDSLLLKDLPHETYLKNFVTASAEIVLSNC